MSKYKIDLEKLTIGHLIAIQSGEPALIMAVLDNIVEGGIMDLPFKELHAISEAVKEELDLYVRENAVRELFGLSKIFEDGAGQDDA